MNPKKISILTQSHLCRNPRVLKEAISNTPIISSLIFNGTIIMALGLALPKPDVIFT